MSSHSYSSSCPVCQCDMDMYQDNRPFDMTSGQCNNCGFGYSPKTYRASFEEVNENRVDQELPKLKKADYNEYSKAIKEFLY